MTISYSMVAFALAASISPGPVNLVGLGTAAQYGCRAGLRHVAGATCGFTLLLLIIGLGLHATLGRHPALLGAIRWGGAGFFAYLAWKLAHDDGRLCAQAPASSALFAHGALMQWLNPKAWLASAVSMGSFAGGGEVAQVWGFAALFFVICYASLACWVWAGCALRGHLANAARIRLLNRSMAALLVGCAVAMLET